MTAASRTHKAAFGIAAREAMGFFTVRLVLYFVLADLAVKILFEIAQGMWWYQTPTLKQYFLFGFIGLDYALSVRSILGIRVRSVSAIVVILFFIWLCIHGVVVGLAHGNPIFKVFNDTVPLIVVAINLARIQNEFPRLASLNTDVFFRLLLTLVGAVTLLGVGGLAVGLQTTAFPYFGIGEIFVCCIFAAVFKTHDIKVTTLALLAAFIGLWISDLNRSFLALLGIGFGASIFFLGLANIRKFFVFIVILIPTMLIGFSLVPEESKTYQRIYNSFNNEGVNDDASVGERDAEFAAIKEQEAARGVYTDVFGFGHGAEYSVRLTHQVDDDRSFAHYSWAWYKMRYGDIGYFYCAIHFLLLIYSTVQGLRTKHIVGHAFAILSAACLIYMFTYVNFVILLLGLPYCPTGRLLRHRTSGHRKGGTVPRFGGFHPASPTGRLTHPRPVPAAYGESLADSEHRPGGQALWSGSASGGDRRHR